MNGELEEMIAESQRRGERFVVATAVDGAARGARLLVWPAGHTFGNLGWPRLNQRVALYAEQLFERGAAGATTKRFDAPGSGKVAVQVEIVGG